MPRRARQKDSDLRQYTTSIAVRDLDDVRRALGYQRINLFGNSYGTRVAQHYARRYPKATRTLILDGVVNPEVILGPAIAIDAERALRAHPRALHRRDPLRRRRSPIPWRTTARCVPASPRSRVPTR